MLVGNLRAKAVYVIIIAGNTAKRRAIDLRAPPFGWLQVGRDEDTCFKAGAGSLRGDGVGQVAGGRAAPHLETEIPGLRERHRHHAIFEAERREADGVILDIDRAAAERLAQLRRLYQWSKACGRAGIVLVRQGKKLAVAPEVRGAPRDLVFINFGADALPVIGNFQRSKTVLAE